MQPEDVLKQYETRINLHVFDDLAPLISDEAVFWFSDGSHSGIDEIRAAFEQTWNNIQDEAYWLEGLKWIAKGDRTASCTYSFHWKEMSGDNPASGNGRGTTVLRKEADAWKIIHEHLSPSTK